MYFVPKCSKTRILYPTSGQALIMDLHKIVSTDSASVTNIQLQKQKTAEHYYIWKNTDFERSLPSILNWEN